MYPFLIPQGSSLPGPFFPAQGVGLSSSYGMGLESDCQGSSLGFAT